MKDAEPASNTCTTSPCIPMPTEIPMPPSSQPHPRKPRVLILHPHTGSPLSTWGDSSEIATVAAGGPTPEHVNGIALEPWCDAPTNHKGWASLPNRNFPEPPFDPEGKPPAAGCVVVEADGRVWLVAPTNGYGNTRITFPKGKTEGADLRSTAIKEVFEESGLRVEPFAHLVDVTRTTSRTRYYLARRIGGSPAEMGWESQAVLLAPVQKLEHLLDRSEDRVVANALLQRVGEWSTWFPAP